MHCNNSQTAFLSILLLSSLIYLAMYNISFTAIECSNTPTLEYCFETYFKEAQDLCSSVMGIGSPPVIDFNSTSVETSTAVVHLDPSTSTQPPSFPTTTQVSTSLSSSRSGEITTLTAEKSSTIASTSANKLFNIRENNPWWTCPVPDQGRQSVIISALVDGRLGNVVWSYLSVLVTAHIYGLRPVLHNATIGFLTEHAFDINHIRMPTLEWLDHECNMSGWLDTAVRNVSMCKTIHSRRDLHEALEHPPIFGLEMYRYVFFVTSTELLVPYFYQLKQELVLHEEKILLARKNLRDIQDNYSQYLKNRGLSRTDIEFVGVHVRRTDYLHHMEVVHSKGKIATPKFFHAAMDWLINELSKPLVFVVVSDDRNWTRANIVADRKDVYLGGDGNITNPGIDLAILAACNHTIFAYGTYGLTGAFLASRPGGYTIVFDPENGTITKEMEFASNLPGWRIMTEDGKITYRENIISYQFYGHPPAELGKNA